MRHVTSLLAQLIIATTALAINMLLVSLAGILRMLPILMPWLVRLVMGSFVLSYRLYALLLELVAPAVKRHFHVNLLGGGWRLAASLVLSLTMGFVFVLLIPIPLASWLLLLFLLHGLVVGLMWDELLDVGGLRMGGRVEWDP